MKKSKFGEEQIVRILKEVEDGAKVAETCRKNGISDADKYSGMQVSQLRHLNAERDRHNVRSIRRGTPAVIGLHRQTQLQLPRLAQPFRDRTSSSTLKMSA
jgi:hypothetical protein